MLDYSSVDIERWLNHYSVRHIKHYGEEINFSCPLDAHSRGDRNPSAYINKTNGKFHCFSCGAKGSLATLISKLEDIPLAVAVRWIRESSDGISDEGLMPLLKDALRQPTLEKEKVIPASVLDTFKVNWDNANNHYLLDRGLKIETLKRYNIGWDEHTKRITFPVHNQYGQLIGFKGRSQDSQPKYLSIGDREGDIHYGFQTTTINDYVWGIHDAKEPKIVVEGEIDAMILRQYGFEGAVALGGSNPSEKQIQSLKRNSESVILMLDPDDAGEKAEKILASELILYLPVQIAKLTRTDPADSTKEEIEYTLNTTQKVIGVKHA